MTPVQLMRFTEGVALDTFYNEHRGGGQTVRSAYTDIADRLQAANAAFIPSEGEIGEALRRLADGGLIDPAQSNGHFVPCRGDKPPKGALVAMRYANAVIDAGVAAVALEKANEAAQHAEDALVAHGLGDGERELLKAILVVDRACVSKGHRAAFVAEHLVRREILNREAVGEGEFIYGLTELGESIAKLVAAGDA